MQSFYYIIFQHYGKKQKTKNKKKQIEEIAILFRIVIPKK